MDSEAIQAVPSLSHQCTREPTLGHNSSKRPYFLAMASSCTGGASFRISGFELGAFDGCYSASAVSTFNFLPIFYNTADSMPADGPTVYASDLFGTLSDEVRRMPRYFPYL